MVVTKNKYKANDVKGWPAINRPVSSDQKAQFMTKNQLFKKSRHSTTKSKLKPALVQSPKHGQSETFDNTHMLADLYTRLKKTHDDQKETRFCPVTYPSYDQSETRFCQDTYPPFQQSAASNFEFLEQEANSEDETNAKHSVGRMTNESHVENCPKEQETYQYKLATKLFASDSSCRNNIESVMEEFIKADNAEHLISPDDKQRILEAVQQWMRSAIFYEQQIIQKMREPLTPEEARTLNAMTKEDWKKLDAAQDVSLKCQLQERAKLLLREYESYPRKAKPKRCRHCDKNYTASTSLHSHLISLSGIRYWVCIRCRDAHKTDVTFTRKHSLLYHILKDNDIPRYICLEPGCYRKHNHTHHQKSHARQHTGEKHFQCNIEDCDSMFSNRNTYSRHLLQFHNIELLRNNELKEIGPTEACQKVEDARLKARERSKVKRLNGYERSSVSCPSETNSISSPEVNSVIFSPEMNDITPSKKRKTDILTEISLPSVCEEVALREAYHKPEREVEHELPNHVASKILSGFAQGYKDQDSHEKQLKPGKTSDGLAVLCAVALGEYYDQKENDPQAAPDQCAAFVPARSNANALSQVADSDVCSLPLQAPAAVTSSQSENAQIACSVTPESENVGNILSLQQM
ncbi:B-cell cll/lymphoma 6 member b protein [Plakobranchus ocellatus]|uniref:B-cell cll/lymphoma 6 member b protein n=1 Tax=Plakobranchus ocellatus TaxID=259542 RepID=A0AAV4B8Q5_9GAST|nr:B-cell cll/lymphoma 6 member b protein [Plakobranchus ocellatus]